MWHILTTLISWSRPSVQEPWIVFKCSVDHESESLTLAAWSLKLVFWGLRLAAWSLDLLLEAWSLRLAAYGTRPGGLHNIWGVWIPLVFSVWYILNWFCPTHPAFSTFFSLLRSWTRGLLRYDCGGVSPTGGPRSIDLRTGQPYNKIVRNFIRSYSQQVLTLLSGQPVMGARRQSTDFENFA